MSDQTDDSANKFTGPTAPYPDEWSLWTKRMVTIGLVLAAIWSLNLFTPILSLLVVSLLLTVILFIPTLMVVRYTQLRYIPSVIVVFLVYLLVIGYLTLHFLPDAIQAAEALAANIQEGVANATEFLLGYESKQSVVRLAGREVDLDFIFVPLSEAVNTLAVTAQGEVSEDTGRIYSILFDGVMAATQLVGGAIGGIGSLLTNVFLVHFLALIFLLEIPNSYGQIYNMTSLTRRRQYLILLQRIYHVWMQFFRTDVLSGTVIGVFTWLQFVLMGLPYAVVVGLFTGLTSLIPSIGGFFALVPIALIPLFEGSTVYPDMDRLTLALLVAGINFVIQTIYWNIIDPKITGTALELSLPVVILGVFIGAAVGGILGAYLVVPIISSVKVIIIYLLRKVHGGDPYPGEPEPALFTREVLGEEAVAALQLSTTAVTTQTHSDDHDAGQ